MISRGSRLDDRKRFGSVELASNEENEKHLLRVAPSAESIAEGASPLSEKALMLNHKLGIII